MTEPAPIAALQDKEPNAPPRSQWADVWSQFSKHKGALLGAGFLVFITLAVLLGPGSGPSIRRNSTSATRICARSTPPSGTARPRCPGAIPSAPTTSGATSSRR